MSVGVSFTCGVYVSEDSPDIKSLSLPLFPQLSDI